MKWAAGLLSLVLVSPGACLDLAQRSFKGDTEMVKRVTVQVLQEAGYSLNAQDQSSVVFAREMTGKPRLFVLYFLSPVECDNMQPRLYVTVNFSDTGRGTLATISAEVEHTVMVGHPALAPDWMTPFTVFSCESVREIPVFMHTDRMLNGLLENIESKTLKASAKR